MRGLEGYETSVPGNESYKMVWRTIISAYVVSRHTLGKQPERTETYTARTVVDWPVRCAEALYFQGNISRQVKRLIPHDV